MPDWRPHIRARLASLNLPPEREAEIVEEVAQHLDDRFREFFSAGKTASEAEAAAWRELEAQDTLRREVGAVERSSPPDLPPPGARNPAWWLESLIPDVRYASRTLRMNPGFAIAVLVTLALSIGSTTAIISVGNWLLWRPIPGATARGIAQVYFGRWYEGGSVSPSGVSYANIADILGHSKTLAGIAGVQEADASIAIPGELPRIAGVAYVTAGFFDVLGVRFSAGRGFSPEEDLPPQGAAVVIISDVLARRAFGRVSDAIGRQITLNSRHFTVIGVTLAGFAGITTTSQVEAWITGATVPFLYHRPDAGRPVSRSNGIFYSFVARMASPHGIREVEGELGALAHSLADRYPKENSKFRTVTPRVFAGLGAYVLSRDRVGRIIAILLGVGGVLLLLGCANVANLFLFRAVRREQEVAVRKTLGADRFRLVQLQLVECWLLALCGALLGIIFALFLKAMIQELLFPAAPGTSVSIPIDWRVLGITFGVAIAAGTAAGVVPAWFVARGRLAGPLGRSGMRSSARAPRLRSALSTVQLALSLALLIGAFMLVSTLRNLRNVELGFEPNNVTVLNVDLAGHGYDNNRALTYHRELQAALESGGFQNVAISQLYPFGASTMLEIVPPDGGPKGMIEVASNGVTHSFFRTLGIPLLRGRPFTETECYTSGARQGGPAIVNETLARRLFGTIEIVGRTIRIPAWLGGPQRDLVVVGVSRDSRWRDLAGQVHPFIYLPLGQYDFPATRAAVMLCSMQPASKVADVVRSAAARIDPAVPLSGGQPLAAGIDRELREQRLFAWMLSLLGGLGFALAGVGLYGLVSHTVAERSREFGIRLALGARPVDIVHLVIRYSLLITATGTASGMVLAFFSSRMIRSMLFGVTNAEPWIYIAAAGALGFIVVLACTLPALRATRVEPVDVLRME